VDWFGRRPRKAGGHGYFRLEAAAGSAQDLGTSYQTPSLVTAGVDAHQISVLSAFTNLIAAFLCTKVPSLISSMGSRKRAIIFLALVDAITWLPLIAFMFFLGPAVAPRSLVVLWIASSIPGRLLSPARDSWFVDTVPIGSIGRQFGMRAAISAAAYLGVFYLMVRLLDSFSGDIFMGFAVVCLIAFLASLVKIISYRQINDADFFGERPNFSFMDFVEDTKRHGLGRFILYICLFNLAVYLCSPLFAVYMVNNLQFSHMAFAVLVSSEFIARAITSGFWGRYSDEAGALPALKMVSYLIPFIPILWLASSSFPYLITLQVFSGIIWAGFDVCSQSLLYRVVPPENRTGYMTYQSSFVILARAGGALLGAFLLSIVFPIHGYKILGIFLLSGIFRFVVAKAMLPRMRKVGNAMNIYPMPDSGGIVTGNGALVTDTRSEHWSSQRVETWSSRPKISGFASPARGYSSPSTSRSGFYYRPQDWPGYYKRPSFIGIEEKRDHTSNPRIGLYHRPEDWATYMKQYKK